MRTTLGRLRLAAVLLLVTAQVLLIAAQQQMPRMMMSPGKMASVASARTQHLLGSVSPDGKSITVVQCRCADIDECNEELEEKSGKCKASPKCEQFLKKIGDSVKIRACLEREQKEMERLEECVEKRVGKPLGCTNDNPPKNLTIPIVPVPSGGAAQRSRRAPKTGRAPMEMSDYLMCVDDCTMSELNNEAKTCAAQPGSASCAMKLRCALQPPDQSSQKAFEQCEQELNLTPPKRFKASCECLKAAGISIECPK